MKKLKIFFTIFVLLAASRFIPHPPNFTSLLALSFYIPSILGISYLPMLLLSYIITDVFIGFHNVTLFTWGSVLIIGYISTLFKQKLFYRIIGAQIGCLIFFIFTNFGVWVLGGYEYNLNGITECYILALPFYINSIVGCLMFSLIFEGVIKIFNKQIKTFHHYKIETN